MINADSQPEASLTNLISSYAILPTLASYISTLDLYHLALTNRTHFAHILSSPNIFSTLRRQSVCDGRGLSKRQAFCGPYFTGWDRCHGRFDEDLADEEIEVRVYNIKCDEADALPCVKCGINVCEECRYYPRAEPSAHGPCRRPDIQHFYNFEDIMWLCLKCDAETEEELKGKFLNELCDCDLYTRWICTRCYGDVEKFTNAYTKLQWEQRKKVPGYESPTIEHDFLDLLDRSRKFWCWCGESASQVTRLRCTWCSRLLPEKEWVSNEDWRNYQRQLPFFDDNPDYPRWVADGDERPWPKTYPKPYPRLGYWRPGDDLQPVQFRKLLADPYYPMEGFPFD